MSLKLLEEVGLGGASIPILEWKRACELGTLEVSFRETEWTLVEYKQAHLQPEVTRSEKRWRAH